MIDQALLTEIQYALLEPVIDGGQTWNSAAWTRDEALGGLNDGQWRLQRLLHLGATETTLAVAAGATSVSLPSDWIASLAAVWQDTASGRRTILFPADPLEADLAVPTWQSGSGTPLVYDDRDRASQTLILAPTPALVGTLDLLYCPRATTLTGNGIPLAVPRELAYGAKWHAVSNLLGKVGRLQDAARSDYAEQRVLLILAVGDLLLKGLA